MCAQVQQCPPICHPWCPLAGLLPSFVPVPFTRGQLLQVCNWPRCVFSGYKCVRTNSENRLKIVLCWFSYHLLRERHEIGCFSCFIYNNYCNYSNLDTPEFTSKKIINLCINYFEKNLVFPGSNILKHVILCM